MTLATITARVTEAVFRENPISLEIAQDPDPFFSDTNIVYVKKSVQELKTGKGTSHELIEVDDE